MIGLQALPAISTASPTPEAASPDQWEPLVQALSSVNWPTVVASIVVGLGSAYIGARAQRWSTSQNIKYQKDASADKKREDALEALRAYEGALQDACISAEAQETHVPTGISFPKNLNELRVAARPHFAHIEEKNRQAYWLMNDLGGEDFYSHADEAARFRKARDEVLRVISALESQIPSKQEPSATRTYRGLRALLARSD